MITEHNVTQRILLQMSHLLKTLQHSWNEEQ